MNFEELQKKKTETELPICLGSPLIGEKQRYVVEKFGVETTDEDIQVALEIRELLLPRNETTVDRKVGFGWFVDKTGTCHYLNTR